LGLDPLLPDDNDEQVRTTGGGARAGLGSRSDITAPGRLAKAAAADADIAGGLDVGETTAASGEVAKAAAPLRRAMRSRV
jgi:hypothetical protein